MKGGDIVGRFDDLDTLSICISNSSLFKSMLRSLKDQCEEEEENELLEHVIPAIDHIDVICRFFIDRQQKVLTSRGGRNIPVKIIGKANLRLVVDNARKVT